MSVESIFKTLQSIKHNNTVYLVGGIVRDLLLKKDTKDIDITIKNARGLAQLCALKFKGSFFPLDEENKIYRVVIEHSYYLDFAELRGNSIEDDLALRDFTIDAMAMELDGRWQSAVGRKKLIDISGGYKDLKNKTIRMVSKNIFRDDPLRLLRAFRLAAVLNFI